MWGNHFIRYEAKMEENQFLYNVINKKFYNDSLQSLATKEMVSKYESTLKEKDVQVSILNNVSKTCLIRNDSLVKVSVNLKYFKETHGFKRDFKQISITSILVYILTKLFL